MDYFWDNFLALCCQFNETPTAVTRSLGISKSLITHWKDGGIPRQITMKKIADHFGVTVEYFSKPQKPSYKKIRLDRIGPLCIEQNISFSELSRSLGIDPFAFSGERNLLSGEFAPLIAKRLGTTAEYLTGQSCEEECDNISAEVSKAELSPRELNLILELRTNPEFSKLYNDWLTQFVKKTSQTPTTLADDARQTVESASALPIKKK